MAVPVEFITLCAAGAGGFYFLRRRRSAGHREAAKTGYSLPVEWTWKKYAKVNVGGNDAPMVLQLFDSELMATRAAMPSFMLHFRPTDLDARSGPDHWLSVQDGNPANDPPGHVMRHYVQTLKEIKMGPAFKGKLLLWEVAPEVAAKLNDGPRRKVPVEVKAVPSGEVQKIPLALGVQGGQYAPAPVSPDGEHGRADWKAEDDMRTSGKVQD